MKVCCPVVWTQGESPLREKEKEMIFEKFWCLFAIVFDEKRGPGNLKTSKIRTPQLFMHTLIHNVTPIGHACISNWERIAPSCIPNWVCIEPSCIHHWPYIQRKSIPIYPHHVIRYLPVSNHEETPMCMGLKGAFKFFLKSGFKRVLAENWIKGERTRRGYLGKGRGIAHPRNSPTPNVLRTLAIALPQMYCAPSQ